MVSDKANKKLERMFNFYSSNFERFATELKGRFCCPLCYRLILPSKSLREVVAEEHIIPRRLGGKPVTLTCRRCNSNHGSSLDVHLIQRVRVETRRYPVSARVLIGNSEHGAEFYLPQSDSEPYKIEGVKKQSDMRQVESAISALEAGAREFRMQINFGYNHLRSLAGLIRAAYLLMFRYFGYRYVLDSSAKPIQWQIQHPLEATDVLNAVMWRIQDPIPFVHAVTIVQEPRESQCFMVILRLDAQSKHYAAVALPPPGQDGVGFFRSLRSSSATGRRRITAIPTPERTILPFVDVWSYYTRDNPEIEDDSETI